MHPDIAAGAGARTNLRRPTTSFVGRHRELAALAELLGRARLVTVLGPPGVGKTRLANEFGFAALSRGDYGEIWFCDLTEALDLDGMLAALGLVFAASLSGGDSARHVAQLG